LYPSLIDLPKSYLNAGSVSYFLARADLGLLQLHKRQKQKALKCGLSDTQAGPWATQYNIWSA